MNIILEALKRLRKDGVYIILLDLASLFSLLVLILTFRLYLGSLVTSIQGIAGLEDIANVEAALETATPIVYKFNFMFYFLFPFSLLLIAGTLQAFSFGIAIEKSKKIFDYKYIGRFLLYTLPVFLLSIFSITKVIDALSYLLLAEPTIETGIIAEVGWLSAAILIVSYFTIISYGMLLKLDSRKTAWKMFKLGKKIHVFLPMFIAFLIAELIVDVSSASLFFSFVGRNVSILSLFIMFAGLIAMSYVKIINAILVQKYQHES